MREHDTLQAGMRFGRDGNGAVVYIHTDTLPDWVPVAGEGRVLSTYSDGMRDVITALEHLESATTADIVEHPAVDIGRRQVFTHLESLCERGRLERTQDRRDGRRLVWFDSGLHEINEHGDAELSPVKIDDIAAENLREVGRSVYYTWGFRNLADDGGADGAPGGSTRPVDAPSAETTPDTPPDPAD
jgi:hypothetical protein